jgi:5-deoxy-glucuronate isomerase
MKLLKHYDGDKGYTNIAGGPDANMEQLKLDFLKLSSGEEWSGSSGDYEIALVILGGRATIISGDFSCQNIGKRKHVFDGKPYVVYLPIDSEYTVHCLENCEIAITGARCTEKMKPFLVKPDEIPMGEAGVLNWKRDIYNLIDERYQTSKLCIGEAFNHPGNWSSYPPHKHDRSELPIEGVMQEIYFFRYNLPQGFGFQAVYTDDGSINETYRVKSDDAVEVPRGYHPYVVAPGYYGYMLWLMAGEKRGFYRRTAPEHAWIDALEIVEKRAHS